MASPNQELDLDALHTEIDYRARAFDDSAALRTAELTLVGVQVLRETAVNTEDFDSLDPKLKRDIANHHDKRVLAATTRLGAARLAAVSALAEIMAAQDEFQAAVIAADERVTTETGITYQSLAN